MKTLRKARNVFVMRPAISPSQVEQLVASTPKFRTHYDAERHGHGPVVITGVPEAWEQTAQAVERDGARVVAFHDIKGHVVARSQSDKPVVCGDVERSYPGIPVIFAGKPNKSWFTSSPPAPQHCVFHVAPVERQQRGRRDPELWEKHQRELLALFQMLEDEPSRTTLAACIRARIEGDTGYQSIADYTEYEHPIVRAEAGDIVVDAGAFEGDTTAVFSRAVGKHGRVVAMEPDPKNYVALSREASRGWSNVVPLCVGAWSDERSLSFAAGGGVSSKICEDGAVTIAVNSIDMIVRALKLPKIDLIKLDVEGAEVEAIHGATTTIRNHRPKLQISLYHHRQDLYGLPALLRPMLPNYRFYLGHHSFYHVETDLYAIPEERWLLGRVREQLRIATQRLVRHSSRLQQLIG